MVTLLISAVGAKQQTTKSCSRKYSKDGGGRGDSGGGEGSDVGSGNDDCSGNSNSNGDIDGDNSNDDIGIDDSNSDSDSGDSHSGGKDNNQLIAAVKKEATAVDALAS
jgi:hypothetical protein